LESKENIFYNFWRCSNICHDVIILDYDEKEQYSGSSQDEVVILEAGKSSEICMLTNRDSDSMTIKFSNNLTEKFTILKVIQFDSDRKMMTVVAKCE
jgi:magnesium-transporting ATPase (P-type)